MVGFGMALDASIVADAAKGRRRGAEFGSEEYGFLTAVHCELEWSALREWDRFCGRRA
jgi:hypothetical protein